MRNTGNADGAEVIQIYTSQTKPKLFRPVKELKAFDKVFLKTGEAKTVELSIPVRNLAYFDDKIQDWVVDSDTFTLHIASSANNIKTSVKIKIK